MDNKLSTKELVLMGLMIALVWLAGSVISISISSGSWKEERCSRKCFRDDAC